MEIKLEAHQAQERLFLNFRSEFALRLALPALQRLDAPPQAVQGLSVVYPRTLGGARDEQALREWVARHFQAQDVLWHQGETLASAWLLEYGIAVRWRSMATGLEARLGASFRAAFPASTSISRLGIQVVTLAQGGDLQWWLQHALPPGCGYLDPQVPVAARTARQSEQGGHGPGTAHGATHELPPHPQGRALAEAYQFFHLLPSAPDWVVEAVYRAAVREYHPDRGGDAARMIKVNAMMARLRAAR